MLVVFGVPFWPYFGQLFCPEAIYNEKGEHVTFDDGCTFSHDSQGPEGSENDTFWENLTSESTSFFGQRFGSENDDFGGHLGEPFGPQSRSE